MSSPYTITARSQGTNYDDDDIENFLDRVEQEETQSQLPPYHLEKLAKPQSKQKPIKQSKYNSKIVGIYEPDELDKFNQAFNPKLKQKPKPNQKPIGGRKTRRRRRHKKTQKTQKSKKRSHRRKTKRKY